MYENNLNLLSEFLGFLKHKIDSKTLTLGEAEGLSRMFLNNLSLSGTAEDNPYGKEKAWKYFNR